MPDLPTLTVSQAHFDRLVAAFPGATGAQKAAAYKAWLVNNLIDYVLTVESFLIEQEIAEASALERATRVAAVVASLPPRVPFQAPTSPTQPPIPA